MAMQQIEQAVDEPTNKRITKQPCFIYMVRFSLLQRIKSDFINYHRNYRHNQTELFGIRCKGHGGETITVEDGGWLGSYNKLLLIAN